MRLSDASAQSGSIERGTILHRWLAWPLKSQASSLTGIMTRCATGVAKTQESRQRPALWLAISLSALSIEAERFGRKRQRTRPPSGRQTRQKQKGRLAFRNGARKFSKNQKGKNERWIPFRPRPSGRL
jgi:hypothetical protein